jgi:hypothetical protein
MVKCFAGASCAQDLEQHSVQESTEFLCGIAVSVFQNSGMLMAAVTHAKL